MVGEQATGKDSDAYEAAADVEIKDSHPDPRSDSPELLDGLVEMVCEIVFPDVDPEPFSGYSQLIRDGIARFCEVVYAIDDGFSELALSVE